MQALRALLYSFFPLAESGHGCPLCRPLAFAGAVTVCSALHRAQRCLPARQRPRHAERVALSTYSTFENAHGNRPPPLPLLA